MNSLISGAASATPLSPCGTPFFSSFVSPFSSPISSAVFGQIGSPMINHNSFGPFSTPFSSHFGTIPGSFAGPFGSPITNQFGGQFGVPSTPFFGSPINSFGFGQPTIGQPIWNQGFNTPFAGQFGFGGGQFGSPISSQFGGQFGSFGTPFGFSGFSPISSSFGGQFNTPFASGFGGLPTGFTGDWSTLGGRFGSFSTPFGSTFGLPFGGQSFNQFGPTPWGFGGINTGWNTGWNNGLTSGFTPNITSGFGGFSPIGSIFGGQTSTPFGGLVGQPITGGFTPWTSPAGLAGFGSPVGSFTGFGGGTTPSPISGYTGTPGYSGQGVSGYSPVSGNGTFSPISPITGNTSTTSNGTSTSTATLNQGQTGYLPFGLTGYNTLPTQLVAGQFVNQGWNTPVVGQNFGQGFGQPFVGAYGTTGPVFNGFQGQGFTSHGTPSELRSAAGTTINVSQRDAA